MNLWEFNLSCEKTSEYREVTVSLLSSCVREQENASCFRRLSTKALVSRTVMAVRGIQVVTTFLKAELNLTAF